MPFAFISFLLSLKLQWILLSFFLCRHLSPIDKLTKEEEEIYKLQHDLERTVISKQQSKKMSEVRKQNVFFAGACVVHYPCSD